MHKIEMAGRKFNHLSVLAEAGSYRRHDTMWRCRCDCGKETVVRGSFLRSNHTKTCGNCNTYSEAGDVAYCKVASGRTFKFDAEDINKVKICSWSVDSQGYVLAVSESGKRIKLHRYLLGVPSGTVVDHINGDPSDCRKRNLRRCTQHKNCYNQQIRRNSSTGYKGVCFDKSKGRYMAHIHPDRRFKFLGYFETPEEAAIAYNNAASYYFGEYAKLNAIRKEEADA